ncbi:MAG: Reeler region domain protein [Bacteroidota bacterium]|nr:Reeler region domain protein [Bacteroidota bacterium]
MKRYLLLAVFFAIGMFLCFPSLQTLQSEVVQPPAGKDGNPNEIPPNQTCNYCHGGSYEHNAAGNVIIKIGEGSPDSTLAGFNYELNKTYTILFNPTFTAKRYGFQMSALDPSNNNAGSFTVTDPAHTTLTSIPINYIAHHNASGYKNWTFEWTSPSANIGDISFYYAFVQADSNDQNTNDTVYKGLTVIHALNTGIKGVDLKNLNLGPNPTEGVLNLSFEVPQIGDLSIDLYSVDGKLLRNLVAQKSASTEFRQSWDMHETPAGIYLVKITTEQGSLCRKVVVE